MKKPKISVGPEADHAKIKYEALGIFGPSTKYLQIIFPFISM